MKYGDGQKLAEKMSYPRYLKLLDEVAVFFAEHGLGCFKKDEKRKEVAEVKNGIIFSYQCENKNRIDKDNPKKRNKGMITCTETTGWTYIKSYDDLLQFSKCPACGFDNKEQIQRELLRRANEAQQSLETATKRHAHFLAITSAMK